MIGWRIVLRAHTRFGRSTAIRRIAMLLLVLLCAPAGALALDLGAEGRPAADVTRDALDHPVEVVALTGVRITLVAPAVPAAPPAA